VSSSGSHLVGSWTGDPGDVAAVREYGQVTLEFSPDGQLVYTVQAEGKKQIIMLEYRVEGDVLVTDQPSSPREERTKFLFQNGRLVLFYSDHRSTYVRNSG
jgi:hypothetical protein